MYKVGFTVSFCHPETGSEGIGWRSDTPPKQD
jgi:hypothetical protein